MHWKLHFSMKSYFIKCLDLRYKALIIWKTIKHLHWFFVSTLRWKLVKISAFSHHSCWFEKKTYRSRRSAIIFVEPSHFDFYDLSFQPSLSADIIYPKKLVHSLIRYKDIFAFNNTLVLWISEHFTFHMKNDHRAAATPQYCTVWARYVLFPIHWERYD